MPADYEILTPATVPAYIDRTPNLRDVVDTSTLDVREIGDGNLNLVFVCKDAGGRGICLKQSLPYVRLVGESWPLTPKRILAEARGLAAGAEFAPGLVPDFYGVDAETHVLAMEYLEGWGMFRSELNEGHAYPGVEASLGEYVARVAFNTSYFAVEQNDMKRRVAEAVNPELCRITEDLVFTEPYIEADNNSFVDELDAEVQALRDDPVLRAEVGMLKWAFMTQAEILVHGDLHSGSVMVRTRDGQAECRVIDPEFGYYGPTGFDLGALFGNFLAARARAVVLGRPDDFQSWLASTGPGVWDAFAAEMRRQWPNRLDPTWTDGTLDAWLAKVQVDTIGFAGAKAIRRIIGLAKVSDIQTLPPAEHVQAATIVLRTASRWIRERASLRTVAAANQVFSEVAEEVLR